MLHRYGSRVYLRGKLMEKNKIVTINGQSYDARTGLRIVKPTASKPKPSVKPTAAGIIHSSTQRSQTLNRRVIKKPVPKNSPTRKPGRSMDIARSAKVTRFAPHPIPKPPKPTSKSADIGPSSHPIVKKVEKARQQKQAAVSSEKPLTSKQIKNQAIAEAMSKPAAKHTKKKNGFLSKHPRFINIFSIGLVLVLIAGYLTYINLPNLSVHFAALRAGIDATYPDYHPDGYSANGPATFSDGEVTINFRANTGDSEFKIKQTKSSWDSSAVRDMVNQDSSGQFITTEQEGLTIYTYDGNAAWVNGGILYTIEGDAPLSGEQIRKIATSF